MGASEGSDILRDILLTALLHKKLWIIAQSPLFNLQLAFKTYNVQSTSVIITKKNLDNTKTRLKLTTLYLLFLLIFWNMRTECERQELTGSRLLGMAEVAGIPRGSQEPAEVEQSGWGGPGIPSPVYGLWLHWCDTSFEEKISPLKRRIKKPWRVERNRVGVGCLPGQDQIMEVIAF